MKKLSLGQGRVVQQKNPEPVKKLPLPPDVPHSKTLVTTQIFSLVGTTFSKYPFKELGIEEEVKLIKDPFGRAVHNGKDKHKDPYAISVQDTKGRHIGYLQAKVAEVVTGILNRNFLYTASVQDLRGGYENEKGKDLNWGVSILVKFYE